MFAHVRMNIVILVPYVNNVDACCFYIRAWFELVGDSETRLNRKSKNNNSLLEHHALNIKRVDR